MIVVLFPLYFSTMLATVSVYEKITKSMVRDNMEYINCLSAKKPGGEDCAATHQRYHSVTVAVIDLLMFDVFSVVLTAYILVPRATRLFWARTLSAMFETLSRCICRSSNKVQHIKMEDIRMEEQEQ
jgi:hypothetical protein